MSGRRGAAAGRIAFLLAAALLIAVPATAQPGDDTVLLRTMRAVGDATSGQRVGNGAPADKVVYFGRNGRNEIVVTSVAALAPGAPVAAAPAGAIALIRTRAGTANAHAGPDPADLALARDTGIGVFIVGEWRTPPIIWEVRRQGADIRWREIDHLGVAGPWRAPAG